MTGHDEEIRVRQGALRSRGAPRVDLSDRQARLEAPMKQYPHFELLRAGRHLGYLKRDGFQASWIARVTIRGCQFKQKTLALADDHRRADGKTVFSYPQALAASESWFRSVAGKVGAIDPRPVGRTRFLAYSPVGPVYTVAHALHDLIEWKRVACSRTHVDVLIVLINHHILQRLGTLPLDEVNGEIARTFVRSVLETPPRGGDDKIGYHWPVEEMDDETRRKQRNTANTVISIIRQAARMAWEDGKTENERAWRCFRRLRNVYRPRIFHLSRPEVRALVEQANPELRGLLLGALYSGCRIGELLAMQVSDVGRDGYGLYVKPAKTFKPRFVFLSDEGMAFFLEMAAGRDPGETLFIRSGWRPWCKYTYTKSLKEAAQAVGLPSEICWHAMRHTYASQLVQAGAPYIVIAEQLGHANPVTVMRTYAHLSPQIRESEVRQRFTSISEEFSDLAVQRRGELQLWRESLHGGNWRTYATITDVSGKTLTG